MNKKNLFFISFLFLIFPLFSKDINLVETALKSGMTLYWDSLCESGILEKNGHQISFKAGDNLILQDYSKLSIVNPPSLKNGILLVEDDFIEVAENLFKTETSQNGFKIGAILIDPGHGGKDPGAQFTYLVNGKKITVTEKEINLVVGKMLYSRLKAAYPDKNIQMTRVKDEFLSLSQRTEIANSIKLGDKEAILYISIHVNASLDKKASGYEVWYLSPGYRRSVIDEKSVEDKDLYKVMNSMMEEEYTTESILIAKFIMDGIQAQVGNLSSPRGIKAEEWFVVRNSNMPAVLVELGFLTNKNEGLLLKDESYLQKLSLGIYNGLSAFVTHFERSRGFTGSR
ncbi:N-acetylmuramoyl-L-alanine amidase [Treponema pectinovorum]|uniref:N-acetylmuramoyl-L-alanine amidase n=1 Tax=Treponema pectinovorum TaxID=164 RepID=UPI003D8B8324